MRFWIPCGAPKGRLGLERPGPGPVRRVSAEVRGPARWFSVRNPCFHSRGPGFSQVPLSYPGVSVKWCPARPHSSPPGPGAAGQTPGKSRQIAGEGAPMFLRVVGVPRRHLGRDRTGSGPLRGSHRRGMARPRWNGWPTWFAGS